MGIKSLKSNRIVFFILFLFIAYILLFLLYPTDKNTPYQKIGKMASPGLPVRLIIPKISINADIEYMGVTSQGVMEVPDNAVNVGWFKLGPQPGEKGNAVIAGHFDGKNGEAGVFINLYRLKEGDKIYVEDNKGTSTVFIVREIRMYDPGYANDVFNASTSAHLNLITCDGVWNGIKKSYTKRLIIFSDLVR